jgi:hypothetical protein
MKKLHGDDGVIACNAPLVSIDWPQVPVGANPRSGPVSAQILAVVAKRRRSTLVIRGASS